MEIIKKLYAKIIAFVIQKGGTGKTTSAVSTAYGMARKGKKVLLVDLDSQANASRFIGMIKGDAKITAAYKEKILLLIQSFEIIDPDRIEKLSDEELLNKIRIIFKNSAKEYIGIPELFNDVFENVTKRHLVSYVPSKQLVQSMIRKADGIDILPCNINMSYTEKSIIQFEDSNKILNRILDPIRDEYDYIILDCPPSLGVTTQNALFASDYVVVPTALSELTFDGLSDLIITIGDAKKRNKRLNFGGVLITNVEDRSNILNEIKQRMELLNVLVNVYDCYIPTGRKTVEIMYSNRESIYKQSNKDAATIAERNANNAVKRSLENADRNIETLKKQLEEKKITKEEYDMQMKIEESAYTEFIKRKVYDDEYRKVYLNNYGKVQYAYDLFVDELLKQIEGE